MIVEFSSSELKSIERSLVDREERVEHFLNAQILWDEVQTRAFYEDQLSSVQSALSKIKRLQRRPPMKSINKLL